MPIMPLVPGARSMLLNGLMQSDMDAANHKIWNLDTSNLPLGNPNPFPAVAHEWINSYDNVSHNFTATQPNTLDLSDWPNPAGLGGKVLQINPAGGYRWVDALTGGRGIINVCNNPFPTGNAVGDGVTDDYTAIQGCLNAAAAGATIYFPTGTYRISAGLVGPAARMTLMGDSPTGSVISLDIGASSTWGSVLKLTGGGNLIRRLAFTCNLQNATVGPVVLRHGILAIGVNNTFIDNCIVSSCLGQGISFSNCSRVRIQNCNVNTCKFGVLLLYCPDAELLGNIVFSCAKQGLWVVNSPRCLVTDNKVISCGSFSEGIGLLDSGNSTIVGNIVQQCGMGIMIGVSQTRSAVNVSFGYTVTGNTVARNYFGGIQFLYAHGFLCTGNTFYDNGQGGTDGNTYTAEPGLVPHPTHLGTGYQVGDVVTVSGGTFTRPAKAIVNKVNTGGTVDEEGLSVIDMGAYSVFPPANPVPMTGGTGSGLQAIFTASNIASGGAGYVVGQSLISNVGSFYQPVRLMVTSVDVNGAVTGYTITDGGGYFGALPNPVGFVGDAFGSINGPVDGSPELGPDAPDAPDIGSGFTLTVFWGRRYSLPYQGSTTFNVQTYHVINGGTIGANVLNHCTTGCGYLNLGVSSLSDRAAYLAVTGNQVMNNVYSFKGKTVGGVLDDNYNFNSVFADNVIL